MDWKQTLLIALITLVATKVLDHFVDVFSDKRNFRRRRRDLVLTEIEELKDQIGVIYEIASNWKNFDAKQQDYVEQFNRESQLLGKYNKYPNVAMAARAVTHQCKIVADIEKAGKGDLEQPKKKLGSLFAEFIDKCEEHLKEIV